MLTYLLRNVHARTNLVYQFGNLNVLVGRADGDALETVVCARVQ